MNHTVHMYNLKKSISKSRRPLVTLHVKILLRVKLLFKFLVVRPKSSVILKRLLQELSRPWSRDRMSIVGRKARKNTEIKNPEEHITVTVEVLT